MSDIRLEHVNITVRDPETTARRLTEWFGWKVRWKGPSRHGGRTFHVGTDDAYVALYAPRGELAAFPTGEQIGVVNHVGVEVEDLDAVEQRILVSGLKTHTHGDYEPGRRFYVTDEDGIEFEIVSYT